MNNQEKFLELFKSFENETMVKLNFECGSLKDCVDELKRRRYNPYYREYSFIDFCRRLRNICSHNINANYYFITDETIKRLETIIDEVKHPFTVYDKATRNIFSRSLKDGVLATMKAMNEKCYTHIPIYTNDGNKLAGIFSESAIFNYLIRNNNISLNNSTTFNDVIDCINLSNSDEFVKFVPKKLLYDDVVNDFVNEFKNNNKLSCVFVTDNGKNHEVVKGIITTWDIIGK